MRIKGHARVMASKERIAVLNQDDDQKLKEYLIRYRIEYPEYEPAFQRMKHHARLNAKGVYPKLKKESKKWLQEHKE